MSTAKLIAGLIGAAAAGVAVGMILAPEKGTELRKRIADTTDDYINEMAKWVKKGKELVDDAQNLKKDKMGEATSTRTTNRSFAEPQNQPNL
jgi:gas vesicle protein